MPFRGLESRRIGLKVNPIMVLFHDGSCKGLFTYDQIPRLTATRKTKVKKVAILAFISRK